MSCKPICHLCNKLVLSQSVTFTNGSLVVNLPAGNYVDGCKYCIVIAQSIPTTATIAAPVVVTIGTGTQQYPLLRSNCTPVTACGIRTRTRYSTCVAANVAGGAFKLLGNPCCTPSTEATMLTDASTPSTGTPTTEAASTTK